MHSKYRIELFRGEDGWYVRTRALNGQVIGVGEKYASKWNAKRAAKTVARATGWPWIEVE